MRESTIVILFIVTAVSILEGINMIVLKTDGLVLSGVVGGFSAMLGAYFSYRKFGKKV